MSKAAWCDLNLKGDLLKIHDLCHNPKCKCQKHTTFILRQFQMERGSIKNQLKWYFWGAKAACNNFSKAAVNVAAPFLGLAVGAKTKNPKDGQATTNIL